MMRTCFGIVMVVGTIQMTVHLSAAQTKEEVKKEGLKKGIVENVNEGVVELYKKAFELEFDATVKSWSIVENTPWGKSLGKHARLLVEFAKDTDEKSWEARRRSLEKSPIYADFYLFDEENVRIASTSLEFRLGSRNDRFQSGGGMIDGELTFKKGEAFRVFVPVSLFKSEMLEKAKRVEVHVRMPKKDIK